MFGQNIKAIALLFGQKWLIFITFQSANKINQFQFWSFLAHVWAKYQGYSLTFWPKMADFHHFSISNQTQSISSVVMCGSFLGKIPRLQPSLLAKNGSFNSVFNLQSKSINFNFVHFWLICVQNTKAIALLFGQKWRIFLSVQYAIKINQFQFWSVLAHFWAKYQGYSLTFRPKMPHFHHFSICNQNQSISILVIFGSFVGKIPRLQPSFLAKNGAFSSVFNMQSKSINFNFGQFWLIFGQNTKAIALLFGQKWLIFITFQSAIKINQFQFWSFLAHLWAKYQGYSLTFWPKMALFYHFSICNQNQSISILVIFGSFLGKIPRLQPYFLATNGSFSSVFNLQSNSINFTFGHFWLICGQNTKAIALLFGHKWLIFITFQSAIKINQFQVWSFSGKIPRLQPSFLVKNGSFSSPVNKQSKSINFKCGHFWLIFGQNTKAIALLVGQKWLIFITCQYAIKINQCQVWSVLAHFWAKYQGYSLTFWPQMAHFHHFSICNQNQSISSVVSFGSFVGKIPRIQPYFLAKNGSLSSLVNMQSKSINVKCCHFWLIFGQNTKSIALHFGQKWLIFITFQSAIKLNQFQVLSCVAHFWAKYQGYSPPCWPKMAQLTQCSICNQNQSSSILFIFGSFVCKIPRLQPSFLAKNGAFSSVFNMQSKSINVNFGQFWLLFGQNTKAIALLFGQKCLIFITFQSAIKINQFHFWSFLAHFWAKYQGYSLTLWPKMAHFHHFSICNQNQSISILVIFGSHFWAKYQGYSLTFWPKMAHFHQFSICNQTQSISILVIFGSFVGKIPRLQPYFLAKNGSFSSLFNLQTKSINFKFWSFLAHFWAKYQGYSLTFWPQMAHFHHFSICNQNQSISSVVSFGSFVGKIPRLQPYFLAKNGSFSSLVNMQSKSINVKCWSFLAHFWAKYQGYSLTFWPKMAHFHHFSICNQNQSISILVIFGSFLGKLPRLQPYFLGKNGSFSSLFNLQSKSINFNFGHFWLNRVWAKYQGYSLTFWPKMAHFHHFSICNQNQSISILVIFGSFLGKIPRLQPYFLAKNGSFSSLFNLQSKSINFTFGHFWLIFGQNTKAIALLFGQKWLIFITFQSAIKINQFQVWSFLALVFGQNTKAIALLFGQNWLIFITFQSAIKSINFKFGHFWLICGQNTKAIALLFGQKWLIFITFQSANKINQCQFWSFLAHFWAKYQGYSLTFWPQMAHFHHFSICNQNQSISSVVSFGSFVGKIPRIQPSFLAKNGSFSSLVNMQSKSINVKCCHFWLICGQNTKSIALHFGQKWLIFITFQSAIKINQFQFWSFLAHFWANYQGYSLTLWAKMAHFHHFSICNQNQSISILVIFGSSCLGKIPRLQPYFSAKNGSFSSVFNLQSNSINFNFGHFWLILGKIPRLQPYFLAKNGSFSSLFNLQSKSINFNFGHFWLIFGQNTKAIALLCGQKWLIFITFQSAIKINQFQFWSFLAHFWAKYQGYSLTFWPQLAHFHHFSICNQNQSISILVIFGSFVGKIPRLQPYFLAKNGSLSSLVNMQSKSINVKCCHFWLIFGQNTKSIALLFGQKWLIFITFQSAIKINQFQVLSCVAHFWAKYQGYSPPFWPKMAHLTQCSICNQNQSSSILFIFGSFVCKIPRLQPSFLAKNGAFSSVFNMQSKSINFNFGHFWLIFGQNTKAIALLFGQKWLIFITFQSAIKINQFQVWSFLAHFWAKYQGYSLTFWPKMAHFHHFSICNQNQSISILVIFGSRFWAKYQGYSLTFRPKMAHFHQFSICNQTQSISILVIFGSFVGKIPRLQPYFLAKNGSFSSLFNLQTKSINFNFGHFWLIFGQNTTSIALRFGHKWLIFITFQSAIKINQFQVWSALAHLWAKYQGYSPPFWPKMAHCHHFSICTQNQSMSSVVIFGSFVGKIPSLQPYILAKNGSFSSLFNR